MNLQHDTRGTIRKRVVGMRHFREDKRKAGTIKVLLVNGDPLQELSWGEMGEILGDRLIERCEASQEISDFIAEIFCFCHDEAGALRAIAKLLAEINMDEYSKAHIENICSIFTDAAEKWEAECKREKERLPEESTLRECIESCRTELRENEEKLAAIEKSRRAEPM
jgi:hypothetical protein